MTPNFKRKILVIKYILTESCVCVWSKISPTIHCVQSKWKQSFIRTFFVVYLPTSKNKPDPMLRKYIIGTYMKWLANNIKDIIKSSNGSRCFTNLQIVQHTKVRISFAPKTQLHFLNNKFILFEFSCRFAADLAEQKRFCCCYCV